MHSRQAHARSSLVMLAAIAAVAATLTLGTGPAHAAPPLDLHSACPGIDAVLQDALVGDYTTYQANGTVHVRLQLEGRRISGVRLLSGPRIYGRSILRAVNRLQCDSGTEGPQALDFALQFTDTPESPAPLLASARRQRR